MTQKRTGAAAAVAIVGIGLGIAVGFAVVYWLGVIAGIASLLAAYLAYEVANYMSQADERTRRVEEQVRELESAVANQMQARMSAEEEARRANIRAADAELGNTLAQKLEEADEGDRSLTDPETGLFGEDYFIVTAEARINSARRHLRPVAVVLIEVVVDPNQENIEQADPKVVTECVLETLREADTACRLADGRFAVILEDTPENGAIWTIERLRRKAVDALETATLWAGVACYPAHGFDTDEVLAQAELALTAARDWPQDRIEIAESR